MIEAIITIVSFTFLWVALTALALMALVSLNKESWNGTDDGYGGEDKDMAERTQRKDATK